MSAFIGRVRNKGMIRRNERAYNSFKEIIANQNTSLFTEEELVAKFKEIAKEKYNIEEKI